MAVTTKALEYSDTTKMTNYSTTAKVDASSATIYKYRYSIVISGYHNSAAIYDCWGVGEESEEVSRMANMLLPSLWSH